MKEVLADLLVLIGLALTSCSAFLLGGLVALGFVAGPCLFVTGILIARKDSDAGESTD